jgi:hypothetical protein
VTDNQLKAVIGFVLFATWVALVVFKVKGADELISVCRDGLIGLGLYHFGGVAGERRAAPPFPGSGQP